MYTPSEKILKKNFNNMGVKKAIYLAGIENRLTLNKHFMSWQYLSTKFVDKKNLASYIYSIVFKKLRSNN